MCGSGHAARGVAGAADLALATGNTEGPDDEVSGLDGCDGLANLDDGTDVLVSHALLVDRLKAAVRPQVRAADTGGRQLDDGVRGLEDGRHRHLIDGDIAGFMHDNSAHGTPWVEGSVPIKLARN